jgi:hypothetical protein
MFVHFKQIGLTGTQIGLFATFMPLMMLRLTAMTTLTPTVSDSLALPMREGGSVEDLQERLSGVEPANVLAPVPAAALAELKFGLCVPEDLAQAMFGPLRPKRMLTLPASALTMSLGTTNGLTVRGPFSMSLRSPTSIVSMPIWRAATYSSTTQVFCVMRRSWTCQTMTSPGCFNPTSWLRCV